MQFCHSIQHPSGRGSKIQESQHNHKSASARLSSHSEPYDIRMNSAEPDYRADPYFVLSLLLQELQEGKLSEISQPIQSKRLFDKTSLPNYAVRLNPAWQCILLRSIIFCQKYCCIHKQDPLLPVRSNGRPAVLTSAHVQLVQTDSFSASDQL